VQTFLPYANFIDTAWVLDRQRLGKQRVECKQIFNALEGNSKGWTNHPATRMWRGYEPALALYGSVMCSMWIERGYNDSLLPFFAERMTDDIDMPPWIGDDAFHLSHQSNLVRKDAAHYGPLFPGVPDDLEYVWPVPTLRVLTPL
jgi:hypothetical protein